MFRKCEGGSVEVVADLRMNIPPPGTVFNLLTGKWEQREIYARSKNPSEQYWERFLLPKNFINRSHAEEEKRESDASYIDVELEAFRRREWDRRLNGFWFYNNGVPTYITGPNYFYLNYYYIGSGTNSGYPEYWDSDRKWWYFAQYCEQDPDCWGFIYLVKRRAGKTQKVGAAMLEYISSLPDRTGGIQSKTAEDAKNVVYMQSIVNAFKRLPNFFKPEYDTTAGTAPKNKLSFEVASSRGKDSKRNINYDDQLNSYIFWTNSKETALDGNKLHRYIGDEVFKTENVNVVERHGVNRFCCTDHNGEPLGLMMYTSTCEEIKGAIQDYIDMWKTSDQTKRDEETNRTITGLYRYFVPSDELRNRDQYGYCDKDANRAKILAARRAVADKPLKLNSLVRKEPLTDKEAFRMAARSCLFNSIKLTERLDYLNFAPEEELYEIGDFAWENGVRDGSVVWIKNRHGAFKVKKGCLLPEEEANLVGQNSGGFFPQNGHKFIIGVDPFDHHSEEISDQKQKSDGSFYLKCKFDVNHPEWSDTPLVEYCMRKDKPSEFYEDVLLCARYYSSPIFFESQKQGLRLYLDDHRYSKFLMWLPGAKSPGIPSSPATLQALAECMEEYVELHTEKIVFPGLIQDALEFDIAKTRKYDRMMAFGWTLVGADRIKLKAKADKVNDISTLFRKNKIRAA